MVVCGLDAPSREHRGVGADVGLGQGAARGQSRTGRREHGPKRADVVVVQPSATGRRAGGRPVWLGLVNDRDATADIAAWIESGGPGIAEPPTILDLYTFSPSRRVRAELDE